MPPSQDINAINLHHYITFSSFGLSSAQIEKFNTDLVEKNILPYLTKKHFMEKDENDAPFLENLLSFPLPDDAEKLHIFNLIFTSLIQIFKKENPSFLNDSLISLHNNVSDLSVIENLILKNIDDKQALKLIFTDYFEHLNDKINFPDTHCETFMPLTLFAYLSKNFSEVHLLSNLILSEDIFPSSYNHPVFKTVIIQILSNSLFPADYKLFNELDHFNIEEESFKSLFSRYFMKSQEIIPIQGEHLDLYEGLPEKYQSLTYSERQRKEQRHNKLVDSIDLYKYLPLNSKNITLFEKEMLINKNITFLTNSHFYKTNDDNDLSFIESLLNYKINHNYNEYYCVSLLINKFYGLNYSTIPSSIVNDSIDNYIIKQFNHFKNKKSIYFKNKILSSINDKNALEKTIKEYYHEFNPDIRTISFQEHLSFAAFVPIIKLLVKEKSISSEMGNELFSLFYESDGSHINYITDEYRDLLINTYTDFISMNYNFDNFISIDESANIFTNSISSLVGQTLILDFLNTNKITTRYEKLLTKIEEKPIEKITKNKL